MSVPRLPLDLEREIFETTAWHHPGSAPAVALVAKRAQLWTEAIIYHSVVLGVPSSSTRLFFRTLDSRPASFFEKTVKHVYITGVVTIFQAQRVATICSGAISLTCRPNAGPGGMGVIPLATDTAVFNRLETLSKKLELLHGPAFGLSPNLRRPSFAQLSHLEVVNPTGMMMQMDWTAVYKMPELTHFALRNLSGRMHLHLISVLEMILVECKKLRVLVASSEDQLFLDALRGKDIPDPRLVISEYCYKPMEAIESWDVIRRGELDFWAGPNAAVEKMTREMESDRGRAREYDNMRVNYFPDSLFE